MTRTPPTPASSTASYRNILWIALLLNALMFGAEIIASQKAQSTALLADAIDFFGDAANYAVSLLVLAHTLVVRAKAAILKGLCMAGFGVFVIGKAVYEAFDGSTPDPIIIGWIGLLAFMVNLSVAWMLYAYRNGDASMRSVWLCSRNDALGNIAVMCAGAMVYLTASGWPDLLVAVGMGALALHSAYTVLRHAGREMAHGDHVH